MNIMKFPLFSLAICSLLTLAACSNADAPDAPSDAAPAPATADAAPPSASPAPKTGEGTYTAEGRTFAGAVKTEKDNLGFFTVTCSGDPVYEMRFHFKNEEAARKGGTYTPGSLTPIEDGEVGFFYGIGYNSKDAKGGTVTVSKEGGKNILEFSGVTLGVPGKTTTVSGKVPY